MKKLFLLLAVLVAPICASAQTYTDHALQNSPGNYARVVPFAPVIVCASSDIAVPCTTKVQTYTSQTLGTPCTLSNNAAGAPISGPLCNNPGAADANGNISAFLPAGTYRACTYAQNYQCQTISVAGGTASGLANTQPWPNCTAVGTTLNLGVQLSSQVVSGVPQTCVTIAAASSTSPFGICNSGCGNSGTAQIAYIGPQPCIVDNQTTINDLVSSSATPGQCTDIGASGIAGVPTYGKVASVNTGAGTLATVNMSPVDLNPGAAQSQGSVSQCNGVGGVFFASAIGKIAVCDPNAALDGNGKLTLKQVVVNGTGAGIIDAATGAAPANPAAGFDRIFGDSASGGVKCVTSSGANCFNLGVFSGNPWLDLMAAGAVCDGATDDTTAINNALQTLYNQGGGTLVFPPGKVCKATGQITLPNDGVSVPPLQKPIRITGWGGPSDNGQNKPVNGGSVLNLTFNAANAKILTLGLGYLEIDHVTLEDLAADCAAFIYTTNTTLHIHDVMFYGTGTGVNACNDAIIAGGTTINLDGSLTAAFQGYDTVIRDNYFNRIRRAVYARVYAQSLHITDNFIGPGSGSNLANGAAIEFDNNGVAGGSGNNHISNNRCEVTAYSFCFKFIGSNGNFIEGNDVEDYVGAPAQAVISFDANSTFNQANLFVLPTGLTAVIDATGNNTVINTNQSQTSYFPSGTQRFFLLEGTSELRAHQLIPATSGSNASSPAFKLMSTIWNGSASVDDVWQWSSNPSAGTNPTVNLLLSHPAGTSGSTTINMPFPITFAGSSGFNVNGDLAVGSGHTATFPSSTFFNDTTLFVRSNISATNGTNHNSSTIDWLATFWNGAASASDQWTAQNVMGAGTNPTSTLVIDHTGGTAGAVALSFPKPVTTASQFTSTLATGTAPLSIASTTAVANLTLSNHPLLQDCGTTATCANTQKTAAFVVRGSVAFPTATTVTVTALPFTGAANYSCTASDVTTAAGVVNATTYTSGSSVTFTETGGVNTDTMRYVCAGF